MPNLIAPIPRTNQMGTQVCCAPLPLSVKRAKRTGHIPRAAACVLAVMASIFLSNCAGFTERRVESWKEYSIPEGNFAVSLPTAPTTNEDALRIQGESIKLNVVMSENGRSEAYVVAYCDYPGGNVFSDSPQELFDSLQVELAKGIRGEIVSKKQVSLDRFTGREIKLSAPDATYYGRLFYVRFRLYQIYAGTRRDGASEAEVHRFLNSFRLLRN